MAKDLIPHIHFENAIKAVAYYEEVFGAEGASRMPVTAETAENFDLSKDDLHLDQHTVHGVMKIFGEPVYFADILNTQAQLQQGMILLLAATLDDAESVAALTALWDRVATSGKVEVAVPFAEQFWGGKFGYVIDQFGIGWQFAVNPEIS